MDRRQVITGAAGAALGGAAEAGANQVIGVRYLFEYEYLFIGLKAGSGAAGRRSFMAHLAGPCATALAAAGAQMLGVFTPQLGWESQELAVVLRMNGENRSLDERAIAAIFAGPGVATRQRHRMTGTTRPKVGELPRPGGIYVHRWFEVRTADLAEFLKLSKEGWVDFEQRFAVNIFGLFEEVHEKIRPERTTRLLLLTRYADHGVWEASRDPTTDAMKSFQRRQQLTLSSKAASTLLATLPNP